MYIIFNIYKTNNLLTLFLAFLTRSSGEMPNEHPPHLVPNRLKY